MLPKSKRIPRKAFKPLLDSRIYLNSEHFSLKIAPSLKVMVAVTVSKKVSKSAVVRNRTRRRVYKAFESLFPTLSNNLFMFISKPGIDKLNSTEVEEELKKLLINNKFIV